MTDELLKCHVFTFNPEENGGEQFQITTEFFSNGDIEAGLGDNASPREGIYTNQTITLLSYSNSAQFNLGNAGINPRMLRKLADEIEVEQHSLWKMLRAEKRLEDAYNGE